MAGGYDVSVKMNLVDNASKKLKTIEQNIDRVVSSAQAYNTVIEKITRSVNALNKSLDATIISLTDVNTAFSKVASSTNTTSIRNAASAQQTYNTQVKTGTAHQKAFNNAGSKVKNTTENVNALSDAQGKLNYKLGQGANMMTSFRGGLAQIAGMYLGLETVKTALDWSDTLTLTEGKLAQLTDDVEGFMNKAYQMSQDTRTSYMDNASQMAKMWQLTGGTDGIFETEDKLIQFNELLNKGFILGGSGTREINASLYQLTQALSSGRLQGDELRSLAENAPYLINTVTDSIEKMYNAGKDQSEWIDLTYNDLKKLGAEGVLTSDLIVDAVLSSADKIRDAYKDVKPTWEQTFTSLKNQVQKISEPLLRTINDLINSEAFEKTTQTLVKMFSIVMAVITPILKGVMAIGEVVSDNWSIIEPIIWGIVGALTAYYGIMMLVKAVTWVHIKLKLLETAIIKGVSTAYLWYRALQSAGIVVLGKLIRVETAHATALLGVSAAQLNVSKTTLMMLSTLLPIIAILVAIIAVIYLVIYAYNKWTNSTVSALGVIVGAFYWLWAGVKNVVSWIANCFLEAIEWIMNKWDIGIYHMKVAIGGFGKAALTIFKLVATGLEKFVNFFIEGVNAMIGAYNSIPFVSNVEEVGKVDFTSGIEDGINKIDAWVGTKPQEGNHDLSRYKWTYENMDDAYNRGYDKGADWEEDIGAMFDTSKLLDGMGGDYTSDIPGMNEYLNSIPNYDAPNVGSNGVLSDDVNNAIGDIKGNTDDIAQMGTEELKYLRDIAEQKVINRFTTAQIKVTNNMNNNISSDRDIDGMADYFAEVIERACSTTAERVNTMG